LYLKICRQPLGPIEIADQVFHCQLGFTDHGAPRALDQHFVALFGACDGSRLRVRVAIESSDQLLKKKLSGSESAAN